MKAGIHPNYQTTTIQCACGTKYPFYTGVQKVVDTAGRIEKFMEKYNKKK